MSSSKLTLVALFATFAGGAQAQGPQPTKDVWGGNVQFHSSRTDRSPCFMERNNGDLRSIETTGRVEYGTFQRQRASIRAVCFEVYAKAYHESAEAAAPVVTVWIKDPKHSSESFAPRPARFAGKRGNNNLVYFFDLAEFDEGQDKAKTVDFYFEASGLKFGFRNSHFRAVYGR